MIKPGASDPFSEIVGLPALIVVSLVGDESSDANVSKLMPEIKVHQTQLLTQLYATLRPSCTPETAL
jgi:hypothetical protein